jgi:hypothetical protein
MDVNNIRFALALILSVTAQERTSRMGERDNL